MFGISFLYYLAFAFGGSRATNSKIDHKKEEPLKENKEVLPSAPLPRLDPTSFTEVCNLTKLNRIRKQEGFTNSIPWEASELQREQALLNRIQEHVSRKTNQELRSLLSSLEADPLLRELAAVELIERKDPMAVIPFILCALEDREDREDPLVRQTCIIGLGELRNRASLNTLEMIKKDDLLYNDAQEAIRKIREYETAIKILAG